MASTMEAATSGAIALAKTGTPRRFDGKMFSAMIPFTFTFEDDLTCAGFAVHADITVVGAGFGDFILLSSSTTTDIAKYKMGAFVQAANVITVFAQNLETSTDEADAPTTMATAQTFRGLILKPHADWAND